MEGKHVYTMTREGTFSYRSLGPHYCGITPPFKERNWRTGKERVAPLSFRYSAKVVVSGNLPPSGFVLDNTRIDDWFQNNYTKKGSRVGESCEKIARRACDAIRAGAEGEGWTVEECRVAVGGSKTPAMLECCWLR